MKATHCTQSDLEKALKAINKKYNGNIMFREIVPNGKATRFTLTVKDCKEAGHRRGFPVRDFSTGAITKEAKRLRAACWHVHGNFFDELLKVNPSAVIRLGDGSKIDINGGNWQDKNIGSQMFPLYFSEACDCQ